MLPRSFTGTILSIGCILTVQVAEVAFDKAIAELDMALAAPVQVAPEMRASDDCDIPNHGPCGTPTLFAGELPPDVGSYLDCERARRMPAQLEGDTA